MTKRRNTGTAAAPTAKRRRVAGTYRGRADADVNYKPRQTRSRAALPGAEPLMALDMGTRRRRAPKVKQDTTDGSLVRIQVPAVSNEAQPEALVAVIVPAKSLPKDEAPVSPFPKSVTSVAGTAFYDREGAPSPEMPRRMSHVDRANSSLHPDLVAHLTEHSAYYDDHNGASLAPCNSRESGYASEVWHHDYDRPKFADDFSFEPRPGRSSLNILTDEARTCDVCAEDCRGTCISCERPHSSISPMTVPALERPAQRSLESSPSREKSTTPTMVHSDVLTSQKRKLSELQTSPVSLPPSPKRVKHGSIPEETDHDTVSLPHPCSTEVGEQSNSPPRDLWDGDTLVAPETTGTGDSTPPTDTSSSCPSPDGSCSSTCSCYPDVGRVVGDIPLDTDTVFGDDPEDFKLGKDMVGGDDPEDDHRLRDILTSMARQRRVKAGTNQLNDGIPVDSDNDSDSEDDRFMREVSEELARVRELESAAADADRGIYPAEHYHFASGLVPVFEMYHRARLQGDEDSEDEQQRRRPQSSSSSTMAVDGSAASEDRLTARDNLTPCRSPISPTRSDSSRSSAGSHAVDFNIDIDSDMEEEASRGEIPADLAQENVEPVVDQLMVDMERFELETVGQGVDAEAGHDAQQEQCQEAQAQSFDSLAPMASTVPLSRPSMEHQRIPSPEETIIPGLFTIYPETKPEAGLGPQSAAQPEVEVDANQEPQHEQEERIIEEAPGSEMGPSPAIMPGGDKGGGSEENQGPALSPQPSPVGEDDEITTLSDANPHPGEPAKEVPLQFQNQLQSRTQSQPTNLPGTETTSTAEEEREQEQDQFEDPDLVYDGSSILTQRSDETSLFASPRCRQGPGSGGDDDDDGNKEEFDDAEIYEVWGRDLADVPEVRVWDMEEEGREEQEEQEEQEPRYQVSVHDLSWPSLPAADEKKEEPAADEKAQRRTSGDVALAGKAASASEIMSWDLAEEVRRWSC